MVRIELFGVAGLRAQRSELDVPAATVGEALAYLIAHNGKTFTCDPALALAAGDVLVILSAQAGG